MTKRITLLLALLTSGVAACNDAEEKCKEFSAAFCERVASCTKDTSSPKSKEACLSELGKQADCSKAIDAPSDFDQCIPALNKLACTQLDEIPDSCNISIGK
jgi:hypothetical protein